MIYPDAVWIEEILPRLIDGLSVYPTIFLGVQSSHYDAAEFRNDPQLDLSSMNPTQFDWVYMQSISKIVSEISL